MERYTRLQKLTTWLIAHGCLPRVLRKIRWIDSQMRPSELLASLGVNIVIDVGANLGQFASLLRRLGYKGRIVSLEPNADCFSKIKQRFAADSDWRGYPLALGSQQIAAPIFLTKASTLSSFLPPNPLCRSLFAEGAVVESVLQVPMRRLDDIFEEITAGITRPVVFLKMDTQGFDREVFAGAANCLSHIVGLLSEISIKPIYDKMTTDLSVLSEYQAAGFELLDVFPVNRYEELGFVLEYDCLMARSGTRISPRLLPQGHQAAEATGW